MIGRTIGGYRIVEQIGMGGMATVYKAYDASTDRYVALKTLPEQYSKDPQFVERFRREARAIAKLEHLHILPLFAYGEDEGTAYLAMRYLPAGTLSNLIRQKGQMPLEDVARILNQIASALDHAHANGVLHRDIKPSNILVDKDNNTYLTDFGIARMVEGAVDLTGDAVLGTPQYMSPEQCQGRKDLTPASDQYSLGVVLYEMVTGRVPFQAETPLAVIIMQINGADLPLPTALRPDLPEAAERVILKSLSRNPSDRYPSCEALARAFTQAIREAQPATQNNVQPATKAAAPARPTVAAAIDEDAPTTVQGPTTPSSIPPLRPTAAAASSNRTPLFIGGGALIAIIIGVLVALSRSSAPSVSVIPSATAPSAQIAAVASATLKPTDVPTATPIIITATTAPTDTPTVAPTSTTEPSTTPTTAPTSTTEPSATPTIPTATTAPSSTPTTEPSKTPTTAPTATTAPTDTPTVAPTATKPPSATPTIPPTATTAPSATADSSISSQAAGSLPSIASTLIAQGDTEPAISLLSPAIEQTPKDGKLYLLRGEAYLKGGDDASAFDDLNQAISLAPDLVDAYVGLAIIYGHRSDPDSVVKNISQAITVQPKGAYLYAMRGDAYRDLGKFDLALSDYTQSIALEPQNPQWYAGRATVYEWNGDLDTAILDLNKAIELDPKLETAYAQRAGDQAALDHHDLALADYLKARELNPDDVTVYRGPVENYLTVVDSGEDLDGYDLDKALADADKAIDLSQDDASLYVDRAKVRSHRNEHDAAISDLNQAIVIYDQSPEPYVVRGDEYTTTGRYDLAHDDFNRAIELDASNIGAYQGRIEASLEADDNGQTWKDYSFKDALADANKALDLDGSNTITILLRGKVYGRLKDKDNALADLSQAIEQEPSMAWGYQERGHVYAANNMDKEAIGDFQKAITLDPDDAWTYAQLGDAFYDAGQKQDALSAYQTYVDKVGEDQAVDYIRDRIKELQ